MNWKQKHYISGYICFRGIPVKEAREEWGLATFTNYIDRRTD